MDRDITLYNLRFSRDNFIEMRRPASDLYVLLYFNIKMKNIGFTFLKVIIDI